MEGPIPFTPKQIDLARQYIGFAEAKAEVDTQKLLETVTTELIWQRKRDFTVFHIGDMVEIIFKGFSLPGLIINVDGLNFNQQQEFRLSPTKGLLTVIFWLNNRWQSLRCFPELVKPLIDKYQQQRFNFLIDSNTDQIFIYQAQTVDDFQPVEALLSLSVCLRLKEGHDYPFNIIRCGKKFIRISKSLYIGQLVYVQENDQLVPMLVLKIDRKKFSRQASSGQESKSVKVLYFDSDDQLSQKQIMPSEIIEDVPLEPICRFGKIVKKKAKVIDFMEAQFEKINFG